MDILSGTPFSSRYLTLDTLKNVKKYKPNLHMTIVDWWNWRLDSSILFKSQPIGVGIISEKTHVVCRGNILRIQCCFLESRHILNGRKTDFGGVGIRGRLLLLFSLTYIPRIQQGQFLMELLLSSGRRHVGFGLVWFWGRWWSIRYIGSRLVWVGIKMTWPFSDKLLKQIGLNYYFIWLSEQFYYWTKCWRKIVLLFPNKWWGKCQYIKFTM